MTTEHTCSGNETEFHRITLDGSGSFMWRANDAHIVTGLESKIEQLKREIEELKRKVAELKRNQQPVNAVGRYVE